MDQLLVLLPRSVIFMTLTLIASCSADADVDKSSSPIDRASTSISEVVTPVVVDAQDVVQDSGLPDDSPKAVICDRASELIAEFEISSRSYYEVALSGVIWPGGMSGPTWGIGYDGGHQTSSRIESDWSFHQHSEDLKETSGVVGDDAKMSLERWRHIEVEYDDGYRVFSTSSLLEYYNRSIRAFGDKLKSSDESVIGAVVSVVYNRGSSMRGHARKEMRAIRDECLPDDGDCVADQILSMCRLWRGTNLEEGLCRRREAEADLIREDRC